MTRTLLPVIVAAAILTPGRALAQLGTPKMPVPPLVEVVQLRWVKYEYVKARYARAGTKPIEYRLSSTPTFANAPWQAFQEGTTGSFVEAGKQWITGTVPIPANHPPTPSTGCPINSLRYRVFLQFRIRNAAMQMINSEVRGDSTCVTGG